MNNVLNHMISDRLEEVYREVMEIKKMVTEVYNERKPSKSVKVKCRCAVQKGRENNG